MESKRRQWWAQYFAGMVLVLALLPAGVNLLPWPYLLESGLDRVAAGLCLVLLPTTVVAIVAWARSTPPKGAKLLAALIGVISLLWLGLVAPAPQASVDTHVCNFGWLTFGTVWVKVQPLDIVTPHTYKARIDWGPYSINYSRKLDQVRYLTMQKQNPFSDDQLGVSVSPKARLSCGAGPIPGDADQTALRGWKR